MFLVTLAATIIAIGVGRCMWRRRWAFDRRSFATGAALASLGLGAMLLVWGVNDGHVPSTADALRTAGRPTVDAAGAAAPELVDRQLPFLGDLLAWPAPLPLATVFGIPEVLVLVGLALALRLPAAEPEVTTLDLVSGQFWWDAPPNGKEQLEVRLPGSVLRARDARLGVEIGARGGIVVVLDGSVTVDDGNEVIDVAAGEGLALGADGSVGVAERMTLHELRSDPWIAPHLDDPIGKRRPLVRVQNQGWPLPAVMGVLAFGVLTVLTYVAQVAVVPSESMSPTLSVGDRVVVAKAAGSPRLGDVVVFERPPGMVDEPVLLVKRVVAIGGERVSIVDGVVFVEGRPLVEPYLSRGVESEAPCGDVVDVVVPPGAFYLLGDNRSDSTDSRCFGAVDGDRIEGTVSFGLIPPTGTP